MKYDILTVTEEALSIEVTAGKITSYRNKNITKKGIRLFDGNKFYTSSFVGDITDDDLLAKANASKSIGINFDYNLSFYKNFKVIDEQSLNSPVGAISSVISDTQEKLVGLSNKFVFNGKFNRSIYNMTLRDDQGNTLEKKYASNRWYYIFKEIGSANLFDGYFGQEGSALNSSDVMEKSIPFLESYKNEIDFKSGRYPVLMLDGDQLSKLSESLNAEQYFEGAALYSNKLNQKIFSDNFSLYDVNYSPEHGLFRQFDEEGTMRSSTRLPLIENGVIKNVISDLRHAKKFGIEATGNGQRSFDRAVSTKFNNLVIGAGKRSTQQILNNLDNCVVVLVGMGGEFTDKGDYSTPLQLSYLLQKGEIIGRLPQITVRTSINEMFNHGLIEIASDGFYKNSIQPSLFTEMDVIVN